MVEVVLVYLIVLSFCKGAGCDSPMWDFQFKQSHSRNIGNHFPELTAKHALLKVHFATEGQWLITLNFDRVEATLGTNQNYNQKNRLKNFKVRFLLFKKKQTPPTY